MLLIVSVVGLQVQGSKVLYSAQSGLPAKLSCLTAGSTVRHATQSLEP